MWINSQHVDEQLIQEVTGHRSHDGVMSYKRTSDEHQFKTNKLLRCQSTTNLNVATPTASASAVKYVPSISTSVIDNDNTNVILFWMLVKMNCREVNVLFLRQLILKWKSTLNKSLCIYLLYK